MKKRRVLFVSLGCPKNQVDGELMLAKLQNAGFENADNFERLDAVIVNTCAFIDSAKQEAIDTILEMVGLKKDGLVRAVIVTGCLAERYRDEILQEIPEVDAVVGIGANGDIDKIVDEVLDGKQTNVFPDKKELPMCGERVLTTPDYWAYLKIAEGCSNCCTYCAIPSIRGPFRSRDEESIVEEAKTLANGGVKELVLIAQDVSSYGIDIYGEYRLAHLLDLLCEIDGIEWIRLLYCYPDKITDELIDTMASQPKVLHYIDLPLQHADDKILKAMNRHSTAEETRDVIRKLRERMPDIAIRTTFIVGFPGEDDDEFETLAEFVNEEEFERLGCFEYSPQEGTPAAKMENQVDDDVKSRRAEVIMQDQYEIMTEKNNNMIGKTLRVLTESYDDYTDSYSGRSYMDAPDIDGKIIFTSPDFIKEGEFVDVEILGVNEYDLFGRTVK
jgi:ribosomal protein S12 methylthiotransferase